MKRKNYDNPFLNLVIAAFAILILLSLIGCIFHTQPDVELADGTSVTVVEKSYSNDPSKLSIGIVNKINLVSSSGTESIGKNKQRILELIDVAKKYDVNMVLFPEFSLTGYFWENTPTCWDYMRVGLTNNHLDWLAEVKSKIDDQLQYIVFNNIRLDPDDSDGKFLNSTYVIDKTFDCTNLNSESNEQLHIYDKTFLPGIEKTFTKSGKTDTLILNTQWGKFGFTTCYDMCFTQIFQEYAMIDKIDGFIQVSSWRGSSKREYSRMGVTVDHYYGFVWDLMVSSQAAFNQAWVIASNAVGVQNRGGYEFWGGSGLWAPSGVKLFEGSNDYEEIIVVHNVGIKEQSKYEHDDFFYYEDFIEVYDPITKLRTFTRMEGR
ncbi:MAG: carbon-nitrogen hydrolase family protein [Deltaproteobacteria bacterium]|nr:carbon-nitrogen hydrolase family protein [Deltaproteobacteria bacterium]